MLLLLLLLHRCQGVKKRGHNSVQYCTVIKPSKCGGGAGLRCAALSLQLRFVYTHRGAFELERRRLRYATCQASLSKVRETDRQDCRRVMSFCFVPRANFPRSTSYQPNQEAKQSSKQLHILAARNELGVIHNLRCCCCNLFRRSDPNFSCLPPCPTTFFFPSLLPFLFSSGAPIILATPTRFLSSTTRTTSTLTRDNNHDLACSPSRLPSRPFLSSPLQHFVRRSVPFHISDRPTPFFLSATP